MNIDTHIVNKIQGKFLFKELKICILKTTKDFWKKLETLNKS